MTKPNLDDADIAERLDPAVTPLDELYRDLGLSMPGFEAFGSDPVTKGKAAYQNLKGRLRRDLCPRLSEPFVRRYIDGANSADTISLVAVLASVISGWGMALNSTLVAILVVRLGIRSLCLTADP